MSSTVPPAEPPAPPSGPPPEYLESGGGAPVPPDSSEGGGGWKKGLFVGGGVLGLAAVGVGAWAAYSFLGTGPQPAEALPADTLGYVSIDLDPSGGQKIEALRTLNKFPAFKDYVGIGTDDDIRKSLFDKIQDEANCKGLDYEDDVEPWLGDRAAVAAVDIGGKDPDPVFVLQVKDADGAEKGLAKIKDCAADEAGADDSGGWVIEGDWAVIAETKDIAQKVVDATEKGSLADDEDFQHWTDEAGDPGVMTMYAGPAAGDYLADHADDLFGAASVVGCGIIPESGDGSGDSGPLDDSLENPCDNGDVGDDPSGGVPDELKQKLRDFKGLSATIRFNDGAIELESAGDADVVGKSMLSSGGGIESVTSLPADTGAAFGLGFDDGWFSDLIDYAAPYTDQSADELMAMLSDESGLDLPDDAETLAGDSAAIALSADVDPDSLFDSPDGADVPVAVKIKGDPDAIEKVLDKLRAQAGDTLVLDSDSDGNTIVIGPNADYRASVLKDGDLGDNDVFKDVVRESDNASTVLFVNVDEFDDVFAKLAEGDDGALDNIKPIAGFGITGWVDDDVAHAVFRLTTD